MGSCEEIEGNLLKQKTQIYLLFYHACFINYNKLVIFWLWFNK